MDNQWKNIFENAEVQPSDEVWAGIESKLDGGAKKGAFFFLAWAAGISAVFASSLVFWNLKNDDSSELDPTNQVVQSINENDTPPLIDSTNDETHKEVLQENIADAGPNQGESEPSKKEIEPSPQSRNIGLAQSQAIASDEVLPQNSEQEEQRISIPSQVNGIRPENGLGLNPQPNAYALQRPEWLPEEGRMTIEEYMNLDFPIEKKEKRKWWAGVSQGVGSFNGNFGSKNDAEALSFDGGIDGGEITLGAFVQDQQFSPSEIQEQLTLSTGLNVGIPIGEKLTLVSGFGFNRNRYSDQAYLINGELVHFTASPVAFSAETADVDRDEITGTYDLGLIPVTLEIPIVDGQFQWSVQAGPQLGIFMGHRIESKTSGDSRRTSAGSIYQPFHLRVMAASTLSYDLVNNYKFTLQPSVEQAVTSLTSDQTTYKNRPLNYQVMLGIRYLFD